MNDTIDSSLRNLSDLNDCGCCEGLDPSTPVEVFNRPGLSAIAYRVGAHSQFKESMLAALSDSRLPALSGLKTRENDDFSIALLDAWATAADVLTFYQERIANESYLRTATERLSLLHLARLIGYELRPGVAASAFLAFTLEDAPGSPDEAPIDRGVKVQSVPGPGEQAQTFETSEKITARAAWNAIRPQLTERHPIVRNAERLFFEGITTGLKAGDGLLLPPDDGSEPVFRLVESVTPQPTQQRTEVRLQPIPVFGILHSEAGVPSSTRINITSASTRINITNVAKPAPRVNITTNRFLNQTLSSADFNAFAAVGAFIVGDVFANLAATQPPAPSVLAFRTRAAIFGHNAPLWKSLPINQRIGERNPETNVFDPGIYKDRQDTWAETKLAAYHGEALTSTNLFLDNVYPNIVKNSLVVLREGTLQGDTRKLYQVQNTTELSKSEFAITSKVTWLTLDTRDGFDIFSIRGATVFAQSEELALAGLPREDAVSGSVIELDDPVDGLFEEQLIVVCGELSDNRGNHACELAVIDRPDHFIAHEGFTRLRLRAGLKNSYVRDTVTINANVAPATHGETTQEVLGSGDASQSFQQFALKQSPLTHTSTEAAGGAESTLQVRVNDLLWREVPTLYGRGPDERVYVTRREDDGRTIVQFGDGRTGARLPTGQENVRATYRKGIGRGGLVKAGQLSQLMTRPLGVKGATNPERATGAADPETLADARRNAPLTVLTLDRVVSLRDYEDFARAFAGIAKALATWTWDGQTRGVFVTVAGTDGEEVKPESELYEKLLSAMRKKGDPYVPLRVQSYRKSLFRISAGVQAHPDFLEEQVLAAVKQALDARFSFEARELGQDVTLSEVMAAMQAVPGVVAVDVDNFDRFPPPSQFSRVNVTGNSLQTRLVAAAPQAGAAGTVAAAELLTLDTVDLRVI
jgi:predicted phage baseplate assembly protein